MNLTNISRSTREPRTRGSQSQANLLASEADKLAEQMNYYSKMKRKMADTKTNRVFEDLP